MKENKNKGSNPDLPTFNNPPPPPPQREDINLSRYNDLKHDIEQLRSDIKALSNEVKLLLKLHKLKDKLSDVLYDIEYASKELRGIEGE